MRPNQRGTPPSVTYTAALSLLPTPGSDDFLKNDSPAGAIAGALVGVMVLVVAAVAVVVLVVLALRRRQRKPLHEPETQERTVDNPIYAGSISDVHGVWGSTNYDYSKMTILYFHLKYCMHAKEF